MAEWTLRGADAGGAALRRGASTRRRLSATPLYTVSAKPLADEMGNEGLELLGGCSCKQVLFVELNLTWLRKQAAFARGSGFELSLWLFPLLRVTQVFECAEGAAALSIASSSSSWRHQRFKLSALLASRFLSLSLSLPPVFSRRRCSTFLSRS